MSGCDRTISKGVFSGPWELEEPPYGLTSRNRRLNNAPNRQLSLVRLQPAQLAPPAAGPGGVAAAGVSL